MLDFTEPLNKLSFTFYFNVTQVYQMGLFSFFKSLVFTFKAFITFHTQNALFGSVAPRSYAQSTLLYPVKHEESCMPQ